MKGLSTTILIVVSAVVILVAALVVLAIFSGGIKPVTDFSQARAVCIQQGANTCSVTKCMPTTWDSRNMNVNGELKSCAESVTPSICTCSAAGVFTCT
jgi:hypothetical protein